jgi:hypothetical protein
VRGSRREKAVTRISHRQAACGSEHRRARGCTLL